MQASVRRSGVEWCSLLEEGVCLVCGAAVPNRVEAGASSPDGYLQDLGWHSWRSQVLMPPHEGHVSVLRLCPNCLADPMFVATSILRHHGMAQMVQWLRSMEFSLEVEALN